MLNVIAMNWTADKNFWKFEENVDVDTKNCETNSSWFKPTHKLSN